MYQAGKYSNNTPLVYPNCFPNVQHLHSNYIKTRIKMDSRRPSDASTSTFIDTTSTHLLEDFIVDDSLKDNNTSHLLPLLYTPPYTRTFTTLRTARNTTLILNLLPIPLSLFNASSDFTPLLPIISSPLVS